MWLDGWSQIDESHISLKLDYTMPWKVVEIRTIVELLRRSCIISRVNRIGDEEIIQIVNLNTHNN